MQKTKYPCLTPPSSNDFQGTRDTRDTKTSLSGDGVKGTHRGTETATTQSQCIKVDDLVRLDKLKKPKATKIELATVWYVTKVLGSQIHVSSELAGERIFDVNWLNKV